MGNAKSSGTFTQPVCTREQHIRGTWILYGDRRTSFGHPRKALDVQYKNNRGNLEGAALNARSNLFASLAFEVGECLCLLPMMLNKSRK